MYYLDTTGTGQKLIFFLFEHLIKLLAVLVHIIEVDRVSKRRHTICKLLPEKTYL